MNKRITNFFIRHKVVDKRSIFCICTALLDLNEVANTRLDETKHLNGELAKWNSTLDKSYFFLIYIKLYSGQLTRLSGGQYSSKH